MGEIPPSTIGSSGYSLRMALLAAMIISANLFQSGSTLKSQWERLFGSFHSMTASTIEHLCREPGRPTAYPRVHDQLNTSPLWLQLWGGKATSLFPDETQFPDQSSATWPPYRHDSGSTSWWDRPHRTSQ